MSQKKKPWMTQRIKKSTKMTTQTTRRIPKTSTTKTPSDLEQIFDRYWRASGNAALSREWRFCPGRRWKFDFAHVPLKVAIEIEGLERDGGARHQTVDGYSKDCLKYNAAIELGWVVLRFTQKHLTRAEVLTTVAQVKRVLDARKARRL